MEMSTISDSPILLLPPELTASIFAHCLPAGHLWPSPREAPLLLAQISYQWREICLDTPNLWASIAFGDTRSVELLEKWLMRARNHPITLFLLTAYEERARRLMGIVKPYCPQWQNVHFVLPTSVYRQLSMSPLPRLRRLTLSITGHEPEPTADPIIIRDAPLLRYAKIIHLRHFKIDIPLEQLTALHLPPRLEQLQFSQRSGDIDAQTDALRSFMSRSSCDLKLLSIKLNAAAGIQHFFAALRCCPNLVDLSCLSTAIDENVAPPLELCSLRSLKITKENMLPYLTAPRLERLEISSILDDTDATTNALQSFLSRSSRDLQFLSIRLNANPGIQHFLRAANCILHMKLHFHHSAGFEEQIQALQDVDVLPRLKHLEIHDIAGGDHYRPLLDVLWYRLYHANLESFELFLGTASPGLSPARIPPATVMADFRALAEAGLRLRVTTRESGAIAFADVTLLDLYSPRIIAP
ncbi:hypothetical protein B0H13DRAFT_2451132 [Mycena leptocephala]|nr:hypothetical protein B0H13DRAFT_2451132 [Mycena leptocephala]